MRIIGLTGGIGAGKSAASLRFIDAGIPVIDADRMGHEVMEPDGAAFEGVVDAFGQEILQDGRIDRVKLGAVVFNDAEALLRLNGLVHPAVQMEIGRRCAELMELEHRAALIEAALHGEDGTLRAPMETLILVKSPVETRIERLIHHRDMSREEALERIQAQTPPEQKVHLARWIIENDGPLSALHDQVDAIAKELLHDGC